MRVVQDPKVKSWSLPPWKMVNYFELLFNKIESFNQQRDFRDKMNKIKKME